MKPKTVVTVVLLAFVAASIVYLVLKETSSREPQAADTAPPSKSVVSTTNAPTEEAVSTEHKVAAYYFFGNVRCQTCRKIESYTAESIASFTNELSTGLLEWRTANVDEKENEHFVKDYELTSRSVVLVHMVDGKQTEWKNLASIWDLVGDKEAFQKYISDETTEFLETGNR